MIGFEKNDCNFIAVREKKSINESVAASSAKYSCMSFKILSED